MRRPRGDPLYGYRMSDGERLWLIDTPGYLERVERELSAPGSPGLRKRH